MGVKATYTSSRPDWEHYDITNLDRRAYGWILKGLELLESSMTRADEGIVGVKDGMQGDYREIDQLICKLQFEVEGDGYAAQKTYLKAAG